MSLERAIVDIIGESISHSHLSTGELISVIFVNIPAIHGEYPLKVSRSVVCEAARDRSSEEVAAIEILAREVKYLLTHAETASEPIFQENEDGTKTCIGQAVIPMDRSRLASPVIQEKDGVKFIDCVARI